MSEFATPPSAPRPTRMLPYIPTEISRLIAQHLTVPSALQLMLSCRALRHSAEMKIWESLNLTASKNGTDDKLDSLNDDEYRIRAFTVEMKAQKALHLLNKHPRLRTYVRCLRIEPSDGRVGHHLTDILAIVWHHIQGLEILPLCVQDHWDEGDLDAYGANDFFERLLNTNVEFNSLVSLKLLCTVEAKGLLEHWTTYMPNLTDIHLSSAGEYPPDLPPSGSVGTPFAHLQRITFDHINNIDGDAQLAATLAIAPNVEFLRLRGHWSPPQDSEGLRAIGRAKCLKAIVACDVEDDYSDAAVYGIEFQLFGSVENSIEEAALEYVDGHEWEELNLGLNLPRSPSLKRLTLFTTPRPSLAEYASAALGPAALPTHAVPAHLSSDLEDAPSLSTILFLHLRTPFPSSYGESFQEPEYFPHSSTWVRDGHRGAIIREYNPPAGFDEDTLLHIRLLSRAVPHDTIPYVAARRYFQDWTAYKLKTVPRYVLNAVYQAAGEHAEFVEGGRNLRLGKGVEAWQILSEWWASVEDEDN